MKLAPHFDLWLKDGCFLKTLQATKSREMDMSDMMISDLVDSSASKACEAARIQADNPTCASEYPVFSKKNSCSHVKTC